MGPKISVIVPVYNVEKYLKECLDSITAQTLDDIDIICVDDGSTDGSPEILRAYAERDPRIRVFTKENAGYGAAVNDGLRAAIGDYVGIVEPDDFILPDMYRKLYEAAKKRDADVVKADYCSFTGEGEERKYTYCQIAPGHAFYGKLMDSTKSEALFFLIMMNWEGIYKREFLRRRHIYNSETPRASFQDNKFWFEVFTFAKKVYLIREPLYMYRTDAASSSNNSSAPTFCIFDVYREIREFVEAEPSRKERLLPVFSYFYFINLMARFERVSPERRAEYAERIREEYMKYRAAGEIDLSLLPEFLVDELEEIERAPGEYDPAAHTSIVAESWAEVERRSSCDEPFEVNISPAKVVRAYHDSVIEADDPFENFGIKGMHK